MINKDIINNNNIGTRNNKQRTMMLVNQGEPQSPTKKSSRSQNTQNVKAESSARPIPKIQSLSDKQLSQYLKYFMTISDYKMIEQGKDLLKLFTQQKNDQLIVKAVQMICYFFQHTKTQGKVCSLQFIKQLMDLGRIQIFTTIQKIIIKYLIQTIQYRYNVKSLLRGSSYFLQQIDKNQKQNKYAQLTRLSNTYFRMCHEIVYVWGVKYFSNSYFNTVYKKLSKYCIFPQYPIQYKFYKTNKVQQLSTNKKFYDINNALKNRKETGVIAAIFSSSRRSNRSNGSVKKNNKDDNNDKNDKNDNEIEQQQYQQNIKNQTKTQGQRQIIRQRERSNTGHSIDINKIMAIPQNNSNKINKREYKQKIQQIQQQQDIFKSQQQNVSRIIQKGSKIMLKPTRIQQKMPKNIIYRQSSVQDPVDATDQIENRYNMQEVTIYKQNNKLASKMKGNKIQLPLGVIQQIYLEDGSSKQPASRNSQNQNNNSNNNGTNKIQYNNDNNLKNNENRQNINQLRKQKNHRQTVKIVKYSNKIEESTVEVKKKVDKSKQIIQYQNCSQTPQQQRVYMDLPSSQQQKEVGNKQKVSAQSNVNLSLKTSKKENIVITNIASLEQLQEQSKTNKQIKLKQQKLIKPQKVHKKDKKSTQLVQSKQQLHKKQIYQKHTQNNKHEKLSNYTQIIKNQLQSIKCYEIRQPADKIIKVQKQNQRENDNNKKQDQKKVKNYEKIDNLPIQSDIQSNVNSSNKSKPGPLSSKRNLDKKRIVKKLFDDENEFHQQQTNQKSQKRVIARKLSVNHAYQIKQLCQPTDDIEEDKKKQMRIQSEIKLRNQRKLRRFRQVAITLVPQIKAFDSKVLFQQKQLKESQIKTVKRQMQQKLLQFQRNQQNKTSKQISKLLQLLKQREQKLQRALMDKSDAIQSKILSRVSPKQDIQIYKSSSNKKRSNSTKRSSLSQIKNKDQLNSYEQSTMLYLMAKRRSVIF